MIQLTNSAIDYLLGQCNKTGHKYVKLLVKGGGCAGFSYEYEFSDNTIPGDFTVSLDNDHGFVVDVTSQMFVVGTTLDYVSDLSGSALKLSNPNEVSSCGCGKSFAI